MATTIKIDSFIFQANIGTLKRSSHNINPALGPFPTIESKMQTLDAFGQRLNAISKILAQYKNLLTKDADMIFNMGMRLVTEDMRLAGFMKGSGIK